MPVYHFTLHAYRSWSPAHRRGFTRKRLGYQQPDVKRALQYETLAKHPKVVFTPELQEVLVLGCVDICKRRGWRLHAIATDPSHFHCVVSWRGFLEWQLVVDKLKNLLSLLLGRAAREAGRRWFVTGGSRKRVINPDHLNYLLKKYLPDHRGAKWREGEPLRRSLRNPQAERARTFESIICSIKSHVFLIASSSANRFEIDTQRSPTF